MLTQASILDTLNRLEWRICGSPGSAPPAMVDVLLGRSTGQRSTDVQSFDSPEEFEAAMCAAEGGGTRGN